MTDITLTKAQGWTLSGSFDGERWSLHVENDFGQGSSLVAACNEQEVYCPRMSSTVTVRPQTMNLFDRWYYQYDAFVDEAVRITGQAEIE